MSIAIVSSSGRLRVERDHRRHQLGERRDRRHVVGALGVDRPVGRRVDDDGVERGEPELARGRARVGARAAAAPKLAISARKTRVRRRFIKSDLKFRPLYSTDSGASPIPHGNQGLVGYSPMRRLRRLPAITASGASIAALPGPTRRRPAATTADRRRRSPPLGVRRLPSAAAATSARTRRPKQEARHACRARRCGRGRAPGSRRRRRSSTAGARSSASCGSAAIRRSSAWIAFSDFESSADVASSKIRMRGPLSTARAIATRCFSPPESLRPRSPTGVA